MASPQGNLKPQFMQFRVLEATVNHSVVSAVGGDFRIPFDGVVEEMGAYCDVVGASGNSTIDINKNAGTILSSKITIDQAEKTSLDSAAQPVISDLIVVKDDIYTVDIDSTIPGTPPQGLTVWFKFRPVQA